MARLLLLADLNFSNNYGGYQGRKISNLEFKSCQSRRVAMAEINAFDEGILVVSCLDMIAADVSKNSASDGDAAVDIYYSHLLHKLIEKVDEAEGKVAFGIVAPLFWTSHSAVVKKAMSHSFKTMKSTTLSNIWVTDFLRDVKAGADGTHLTTTSSKRYIDHIVNLFMLISEKSGICPVQFDNPAPTSTPAPAPTTSWADDQPLGQDPEAVVTLGPPDDDIVSPARTSSMVSVSMLSSGFSTQQAQRHGMGGFRAMANPGRSLELGTGPTARAPTNERLLRLAHDSTPGTNFSVPPPGFASLQQQNSWRTPDVNSSMLRIEQRLGALEAKVFFDNVMMASLKEEQDTAANRAMLNRLTMTGITLEGLDKMTSEERIKAIKDKVDEIIGIVKKDDKVYKVVFVKHLNPQVRGQQKAAIEVKLESEKQASDLRADFVQQRKDKNPDLPEKMNISPVVRLATRVRIEILHSVTNLLLRHDSTIIRAMCLQYIPKPVIKIIRRSAGGNEYARTMTFAEAVCWVKEEGYTSSIGLSRAYERAGSAFRGTLTQSFVLLHSAGFN